MTAWSRSTWSQVSARSSPGRRPSVIASTNRASSCWPVSAGVESEERAAQSAGRVLQLRADLDGGCVLARLVAAGDLVVLGGRVSRRGPGLTDPDHFDVPDE